MVLSNMSAERAKIIERAMKITFDSLQSHLKGTYEKGCTKCDNMSFDKRCVKEYAELIQLLSRLY